MWMVANLCVVRSTRLIIASLDIAEQVKVGVLSRAEVLAPLRPRKRTDVNN
jgi:hypothetical protein